MKQKKISKRLIKNNLTAYSFIIVSLVTLLVLVYIPMISTVDYSFRRIGMVGFGDEWVGLENYRMLFSQSAFWRAIGNTILLAVMGLLTIPVGFLLAVLINSLGRGKLQEFFRVGFYHLGKARQNITVAHIGKGKQRHHHPADNQPNTVKRIGNRHNAKSAENGI